MIDLEKLFSLAEEQNLEALQVIENREEGLALTWFEGKLEKNEISDVSGLTVSGIVNGKRSVYTIENMDMPEADVIRAIYESASHMTGSEVFEIFEGSESYPEIAERTSDFHEIPLSKKIGLLAEVEKKIRAKEPRVAQIPGIEYEESVKFTRIINSRGLDIQKKNEYCVLDAELVASDGKAAQVGFEVEFKNNFNDFDVDGMVDKAIRMAVDMFDAEPVPTGEYPVIIENKAMISLLSSFSGMFSGETHLKKISPIQGKLGQKVFSDLITIHDMPLKEDAVLRQPFDEEGVACRNKTVVDKGVFTTMLHNLKTAKAFDTVSTGSAFGGAPSGCNLFIEAGERSKEELIASIGKGLLLTNFDGLHAGLNAISGDMSLKTCGFYIEGGKIVKPVTLIIMAGNFVKMMNDVEAVGSDLEMSYRGIGAPSVKFRSVSISG